MSGEGGAREGERVNEASSLLLREGGEVTPEPSCLQGGLTNLGLWCRLESLEDKRGERGRGFLRFLRLL